MEKARVQKFIADSGMCSRRKAEELIKQGKVTINGVKAKLGDHCYQNDDIRVGGRRLKANQNDKVYFLMNKALSYVCSKSDPHNKQTVFDLLRKEDRIGNLFTVGRLDKDTTGLLILTNDGYFANKIIHPSSKIVKEYICETDKKLKQKDQLERGIKLDGVKLAPCKITSISDTRYKVQINEGRKRQVRRMFESAGLRVLKLHREKIGNLTLGNIKEGKYKKVRKDFLMKVFE